MVPLGLTHIHAKVIGDVLLCLCKPQKSKLQGPKLMQFIASLKSD